MQCNSVSFEDFLALSEKAEGQEEQTSKKRTGWIFREDVEDKDSFEYDYPEESKIPSIPAEALERFLESNNAFVTSSANTQGSLVRNKHDINWCSPKDYADNWDLLSATDQRLLRKLMLSDMVANSNRYGLKAKNLETHLLLSIGCDMNNIINNARCSIFSNLKSPNDAYHVYSTECVDNKAVDAKTCLRAYKKWASEFDPSILFKNKFVCYQAVITSDSSYRDISDFSSSKKRYHSFFKSNSSVFAGWLKKKKIYSYLYSHEVSVDSILRKEYRPHTHFIFFLPKEKFTEQRASVLELENEFNAMFSDRSFELLRKEVDGSQEIKKVSKYEKMERAFNYLHNCYSLAPTYMREIRETNIRELNLKTVECYRNLIDLFKNEEGLEYRPVRRFNSSMIPKKGTDEGYQHPLLQKKKKSNTIKKAARVISSENNHVDTKRTIEESDLRNETESDGSRQSGVSGSNDAPLHESERKPDFSGNVSLSSDAADAQGTTSKVRSARSAETVVRPGDASRAGEKRQISSRDAETGIQIFSAETRSTKTSAAKRSDLSNRKRKRQDCSKPDSSKQPKTHCSCGAESPASASASGSTTDGSESLFTGTTNRYAAISRAGSGRKLNEQDIPRTGQSKRRKRSSQERSFVDL